MHLYFQLKLIVRTWVQNLILHSVQDPTIEYLYLWKEIELEFLGLNIELKDQTVWSSGPKICKTSLKHPEDLLIQSALFSDSDNVLSAQSDIYVDLKPETLHMLNSVINNLVNRGMSLCSPRLYRYNCKRPFSNIILFDSGHLIWCSCTKSRGTLSYLHLMQAEDYDWSHCEEI